jgi:hypothetical protein
LVVQRPARLDVQPLTPLKSGSRKLGRRISPIGRIVASLDRKRDPVPAFGGATPKGEARSSVLDTETALLVGSTATSSQNLFPS